MSVRQAASTVTMVLAGLVVLGVLVQIYLAGAYVFGADTLDAHKDLGWIVHTVEMVVFIAALVARSSRDELLLALGLLVLGTVQVLLAQADEYVGGLHPLLALVVLGLAGGLLSRGLERRRSGAVVA